MIIRSGPLCFLRILFAAISIFMIYTAIATSIESNLFEAWDGLAAQPWVRATLIDFYFNILIFLVWVFYKEGSFFKTALWGLLFVVLGSIATAFYVFLKLLKVRPGDPVSKIFLPEK